MNRETFLATVRQATQSGRRYRIAHESIPSGAGYVGAAEDLCAALAAEIRSVGGEAQVADNWHSASVALRELLQALQPDSAICWQHPALDRLSLAPLLAELDTKAYGYQQLVALPEHERRATILAADVGISGVDWAIAETGTLVVTARPGQERAVSLVPPIHIAVVAADQIVPDLFDLFSRLIDRGLAFLPGNLVLITGPSKTGDIELELTTGIHGPGKWLVMIVRAPLNESGSPSQPG